MTHEPQGLPVEHYLKSQGRFKHLTKKDVRAVQKEVEQNWEDLGRMLPLLRIRGASRGAHRKKDRKNIEGKIQEGGKHEKEMERHEEGLRVGCLGIRHFFGAYGGRALRGLGAVKTGGVRRSGGAGRRKRRLREDSDRYCRSGEAFLRFRL